MSWKLNWTIGISGLDKAMIFLIRESLAQEGQIYILAIYRYHNTGNGQNSKVSLITCVSLPGKRLREVMCVENSFWKIFTDRLYLFNLLKEIQHVKNFPLSKNIYGTLEKFIATSKTPIFIPEYFVWNFRYSCSSCHF